MLYTLLFAFVCCHMRTSCLGCGRLCDLGKKDESITEKANKEPAVLSYSFCKPLESSTSDLSVWDNCCSVTLCNPMDYNTPASLSFSIFQSLLKLMSIDSAMPSISSSVAHFSSCPQSFPASWSFPMSQLFTSRGQSIGASASASASVLPVNIQSWFPLGLTGLIPLQSKGLSINLWCSRWVDSHSLVGSARKVLSNSPPKAWNLYKGPRRWTLLPRFRKRNPPTNMWTGWMESAFPVTPTRSTCPLTKGAERDMEAPLPVHPQGNKSDARTFPIYGQKRENGESAGQERSSSGRHVYGALVCRPRRKCVSRHGL